MRLRAKQPRRLALVLVTGFVFAALGLEAALQRASRLDAVAHVRVAPSMRLTTARHESTQVAQTAHWTLSDARGRIQAKLRVPNAPGPHPLLVVLGGLRTGRHAIDLVPPEQPYAVAALDYAHDGRQLDGPAAVGLLPWIRRDLLRTAVGLRDLLRLAAAHPAVDASRIYLVGASLGSPIACTVAAAEPVAGLVLLYGFADHEALLEHRLRAHLRWQAPRRLLARSGARLLQPFDAQHNLPRACGTPVLLVESSEDTALPRRCSEALWQSACAPRQRVELPGGHIDSKRKTEILQAVTRQVRDRIDAGQHRGTPGERERAAAARL